MKAILTTLFVLAAFTLLLGTAHGEEKAGLVDVFDLDSVGEDLPLDPMGIVEISRGTAPPVANYRIKKNKSKAEYAIHFNQGLSFQKAGQYKLALDAYEMAAHAGPPSGELYNNLGLIHYIQGDHQKAEKALEQAISLNSQSSKAYNNMGILMMDQRQDVKAITSFQKAYDLDPTNVDAVINLGILFMRKGNLKHARTQFNRAMTINYNKPEVHYNLGVLELKETYYFRAKFHFDTFNRFATQPQKMRVHDDLAQAYKVIKENASMNMPEQVEDFTETGL